MTSRRIPAGSVDVDTTGRADLGRRPPRLTTTVADGPPMVFGQPTSDVRLRLDPQLAHHVDQLVAEARATGLSEGRDAGRREAEARIDRLAQAISLTVGEIEDRMERTRQGMVGGLLDLARAIATQVIGRTPHDGGLALLQRLEEVVDRLDERPLTIVVSDIDLDIVRTAVAEHPDLAVRVDAHLAPGEARVEGGWSHADLTYEAAWQTIERHLGDT